MPEAAYDVIVLGVGGMGSAACLELTADEIGRRFPAFRFPDGYLGITESEAGFLAVEECVRAHIDGAVSLGAEVRGEEPARGWKAVGGGVEVTTDRGTYHAARLVV